MLTLTLLKLVIINIVIIRFESRRDFQFDNTLFALLTLFQVLTLEGWLDVRDVFSSVEDAKINLVCCIDFYDQE